MFDWLIPKKVRRSYQVKNQVIQLKKDVANNILGETETKPNFEILPIEDRRHSERRKGLGYA